MGTGVEFFRFSGWQYNYFRVQLILVTWREGKFPDTFFLKVGKFSTHFFRIGKFPTLFFENWKAEGTIIYTRKGLISSALY